MQHWLLIAWSLDCFSTASQSGPTPWHFRALKRQKAAISNSQSAKKIYGRQSKKAIAAYLEEKERHEWEEAIAERRTIYFPLLPVWISIKLASVKLKVTRLAPFHLKCWWGSWHNYQGRHLSQEAAPLIAEATGKLNHFQGLKKTAAKETMHS